eukprot:1204952-Amphidinium_carterae.1
MLHITIEFDSLCKWKEACITASEFYWGVSPMGTGTFIEMLGCGPNNATLRQQSAHISCTRPLSAEKPAPVQRSSTSAKRTAWATSRSRVRYVDVKALGRDYPSKTNYISRSDIPTN